MKSILVIDIDDELIKQMGSRDFIVTDRYGSKTIYPVISFKPMPERKEIHLDFDEVVWDDEAMEMMKLGYNKCINEILGDQNERI